MGIVFIILFALILWSSCKVVDESKREKELWDRYMEDHMDYKK